MIFENGVCLAQVVGRATDGYKSYTQKMFDLMPSETGVGGAGGTTTYDALKSADKAWNRLKVANVSDPSLGGC